MVGKCLWKHPMGIILFCIYRSSLGSDSTHYKLLLSLLFWIPLSRMPTLLTIASLVLASTCVLSSGKHVRLLSLILWTLIQTTFDPELPKIKPFSFPTRVSIGSAVSVICSTSAGDQPLSFQWFKDGQELLSDTLVFVSSGRTSSMLEVSKVQESNGGNYSCRVSNPIGSDSFTTQLEIECKLFWCNLLINTLN